MLYDDVEDDSYAQQRKRAIEQAGRKKAQESQLMNEDSDSISAGGAAYGNDPKSSDGGTPLTRQATGLGKVSEITRQSMNEDAGGGALSKRKKNVLDKVKIDVIDFSLEEELEVSRHVLHSPAFGDKIMSVLHMHALRV
jgi:hypothetical protein